MDEKPPLEASVDSGAPSGARSNEDAEDSAARSGGEEHSLPEFLATASTDEIATRFERDAQALVSQHEIASDEKQILCLMDGVTYISDFDLDKIFSALKKGQASGEKGVLLILFSRGGSIEPAYQISKICRQYSSGAFQVAVPRHAKSAATLIAIGADEIHMGPLGHLGPIDPQLGGLPALGVSQALSSIAAVSEKHPDSAGMLSRYLNLALTVEQIGYCERIAESAAQYAERLLSNKKEVGNEAPKIARKLVHEYKDHGFVIDLQEAREHLGKEWIKDDTNESRFAEDLYDLFNEYQLLLRFLRRKRILVVGNLGSENIHVWPIRAE